MVYKKEEKSLDSYQKYDRNFEIQDDSIFGELFEIVTTDYKSEEP